MSVFDPRDFLAFMQSKNKRLYAIMFGLFREYTKYIEDMEESADIMFEFEAWYDPLKAKHPEIPDIWIEESIDKKAILC